MFEIEDPYIQFLEQRRDLVFYVKPYKGNSGDCLIRMGTLSLLSRLGIMTTVNPKEANIVLFPGGNPTMWPENGWSEMWGKNINKEILVGPATFQYSDYDWVNAINESSSTVSGLFARDPVSYENLQKAKFINNIAVGLSHDPALILNDTEWIKSHKNASTDEYVLESFREDHEAYINKKSYFINFYKNFMPWFLAIWYDRVIAMIQEKKRTGIVNKLGKSLLPHKIIDASALDFESFVETIRCASEVHTDRLHCMLLAVMLGKPTYAYPTSYGKLETIYKHSLKSLASVTLIPNSWWV